MEQLKKDPSILPVAAPALLALLAGFAATSADFDRDLGPPAGVAAAADLGRADREEEEEGEEEAATIAAISGHFRHRRRRSFSSVSSPKRSSGFTLRLSLYHPLSRLPDLALAIFLHHTSADFIVLPPLLARGAHSER